MTAELPTARTVWSPDLDRESAITTTVVEFLAFVNTRAEDVMAEEVRNFDQARQEAANWLTLLNSRTVSTNSVTAFRAWRRDPLNAAAYLPASAPEDFRQVAILSAPVEQRRFGDARAASNPQSPAALYGDEGMAEVQIRTVSFINDKVASVRFRRTVRRAQATSSEDWIATAAFAYTRAPMREADRLLNPLGFQITSYRADPEAAP